MTIFYVRKSGSDINNGQSPAQAWLTIGHALASQPNGAGGTNPSAGDTIYVGSGVYREQINVGNSGGTPGNPISLVGDIDGSKTGDPPGLPRWTGYDTSDTAIATGGNIVCNLGARTWFTFRQLCFHAARSYAVQGSASVGITLQDCLFVSGSTNIALVSFTAVVDVNSQILVDRCRFIHLWQNSLLLINFPTSTIADYNAGVVVQNCLFVGGANSIQLSPTGANTFKGGGVTINNCSMFFGTSRGVSITGANLSTTYPITVNNCLIACTADLVAAVSGQIVENYNVLYGPTPYTLVTAGSNSISNSSYAMLLAADQDHIIGRSFIRHFFAPTIDSPLANFGSAASPPLVDLWNRQRPSGGTLNAVGCLEVHDFGIRNTSLVPSGSASSLLLSGSGDQELLLPVAPTSTTVSIQVYRDGSYGGGPTPAFELLAAPELGVAGQIVADPGGATTWNTVSLGAFTPTARGAVRLRLHSYAAATGNCYWGALAVA